MTEIPESILTLLDMVESVNQDNSNTHPSHRKKKVLKSLAKYSHKKLVTNGLSVTHLLNNPNNINYLNFRPKLNQNKSN